MSITGNANQVSAVILLTICRNPSSRLIGEAGVICMHSGDWHYFNYTYCTKKRYKGQLLFLREALLRVNEENIT